MVPKCSELGKNKNRNYGFIMFCDEVITKLLSDRYPFVTMFRIFFEFYFKIMLSLQKMSEYRGFFSSYFQIFELKTEIYSMNLLQYRKIQIRKNSHLDSFLTVFQTTKFNQKSGKREKTDTLFAMEKENFSANV